MGSRSGLAWSAVAVFALSGCFDSSVQGGSPASDPATDGGGVTGTQNTPPTISGSPPAHVLQDQPYEFTPNASDGDGDTLEFEISRKPAWARFDRSTGRLSGTPGAADVGSFTNIRITVSDGKAQASLGDFHITVNQTAAGTATLSWLPPTENVDGSPLADLAGYRIYYGRDRNNLTQTILLDNPGLTRHVVENLTPARWFFTMTSVNSRGAESPRTEIASKIVG